MNRYCTGRQWRRAQALCCLGMWLAVSAAQALALEFDPRFLQGEGGPAADVSRFQLADAIPEGEQLLDVVINEDWSGRWPVLLRRQGDDNQAHPCYSATLLDALAIDQSRLAASAQAQLRENDNCVPLSALGLQASEQLDHSALRLNLQIAQQALLSDARDYLPAQQWSSGTQAAFVDYRLNLFSQQSRADSQHWNQSFLGLRSGANTGAWYWRHEGNLQAGEGVEQRYQPVATYVRRDVPMWKAQLTLGEAFSRGEVFDSIGYLGLGVGSDERMLPASRRGFAPTVSGIAYSTALLTIRQRGVVVHESTVQPGPFEISDLYSNGYSDDLQVTIREADGNQRIYTVPYQAAPLALRPGASRFDFSLGRWRDGLGNVGPEHLQGSWQQGLSNYISLHGGVLGADGYHSAAMGLTLNSQVGAVALTVLGSRAEPTGLGASSGEALRLHWRHVIATSMTDLSVSLSGNRPGYYGFNDFARGQGDIAGNLTNQQVGVRASVAVNQGLGDQRGRLSLQAARMRYSRQAGSGLSYSVGYFNRYGSLGYGITASREQSASTGHFNQFGLALSMPLGRQRRSSLSSSWNGVGKGQSSSITRLTTTAGEHSEWSYGLGLSTAHHQQRNTAGVDASLRYSGAASEMSGSLLQHSNYRQVSVGVRGAVVAHAGGLTGAQSLGESFAIVHAPGAEHARLKQAPQVRLDRYGYGVLPQLSPYSLNTVELDPKGTSQDVELQVSSQQVVPRAGAAPLLYYPTRSGRSALIDARLADGSVLPFGASVINEAGDELGMVGQGSRLHVRGIETQGSLQVRWGQGKQQRCWVSYQLPALQAKGNGPAVLVAICEPGGRVSP